MKRTISLPENVKYIIDTFYNAGYKAYAVGGCVRDSLMGNHPNDWDICTNAQPNKVKQIFTSHSIIDTGLKHGTVTLLIDNIPYEITTFRKESTYSDNRRPDSVEFVSSLKEDLSRRDFTVNAIAYNHYEGITDYFSGQEDLEKGIIRTVGDADTRFNEDALRILRGIRFASTLGFTIDNKTKESIHYNKNLLENIAVERVWIEFKKLIAGKNAVQILREFPDVVAGMTLLNVQTGKVVICQLYLRTVYYLITKAHEDLLDLLQHHVHGMLMAHGDRITGDGHVQCFACQLCLQDRRVNSGLALFQLCLNVSADRVCQLTHNRPLLSAELAHHFQNGGELTLFAQPLDPEFFQGGRGVGCFQSGQGLKPDLL